jgi:hypothetical protein
MDRLLLPLDPAGYRPHPLHAGDRIWPETNCYVDLWIELLHAMGQDPLAALPFTVEQDFEGDQFTFFKMPLEDLHALYGLRVQELAIYDTVEAHAAEQLRRGCVTLIEVDSFYLPDTRGVAYRDQHVKTTIAVASLDREGRRLTYFHNAGLFALEGEDYDGVFRRLPHLRAQPDLLFPYVEFVKRAGAVRQGATLLDASLGLLGHRLRGRPARNPITAFREEFPRHQERLAERPMGYFHDYAFNLLRQFGANMELLGSYTQWLEGQGQGGLADVRKSCIAVATDAKTLQFQLARAVSRKRFGDYSDLLDRMERAHDTALNGLAQRYG